MKPTLILALVLILCGVAVLGYQKFSYRTQETVLDIGPIKATAERTKTVPLPPILGFGLIAGGVAVLIFGRRSGNA